MNNHHLNFVYLIPAIIFSRSMIPSTVGTHMYMHLNPERVTESTNDVVTIDNNYILLYKVSALTNQNSHTHHFPAWL